MLINGHEYSIDEIEAQIRFLNEAIKHYQSELKKWKASLKEAENPEETYNGESIKNIKIGLTD